MKRLERDLNQARTEAEKAQQEKAGSGRATRSSDRGPAAAEKKRETLEQRAKAAEEALLRANAEGSAESEQTKALVPSWPDAKRQLRNLKLEADAETEFRQQLNDRLRGAQKKIRSLNRAERWPPRKRAAKFRQRIAEIQKQLDLAQKEKKDLTTRLSQDRDRPEKGARAARRGARAGDEDEGGAEAGGQADRRQRRR